MKQVKQAMLALIITLAAFTSCKKDTTQTTTSTTENSLKKIEHNNSFAEISYNDNGTLKSVVTKLTNGNIFSTTTVVYENGKIKQLDFGTHISKYTYTGNLVTKIEKVNNTGTVIEKKEFTYLNSMLTEMVEHVPNGALGLRPFAKSAYNYNDAGNVVKTEIYGYTNNTWIKTEEVLISNYDNKKNTITNMEIDDYLPNIKMLTNNPLQEDYKDAQGNVYQTISHFYTYDTNDRPTIRISTIKEQGYPDYSVMTKFHY